MLLLLILWPNKVITIMLVGDLVLLIKMIIMMVVKIVKMAMISKLSDVDVPHLSA